MKVFLIILLNYACCAFCQGSWNIGYVEVDPITPSLIGEPVKIDFKQFASEKKGTSRGVRSHLVFQDSARISLDSAELIVLENWKIYVDHGSFEEQYLEVFNRDKLVVERIYEAKLLEISGGRLKFIVTIDSYRRDEKSDRSAKINSKVKEFWLSRSDIDGLLVKI